MKEIFINQDKETRCYIMAAIFFFEGYRGVYNGIEILIEGYAERLGLSYTDMENFPKPDYDTLVTNISKITDKDIQHFVIRCTYLSVLESKRNDALHHFKMFCLDLKWDVQYIEEIMRLTEELLETKPVFNPYPLSSTNSNIQKPNSNNPYNNNGCLRFFIIFAVTFILGLLIF